MKVTVFNVWQVVHGTEHTIRWDTCRHFIGMAPMHRQCLLNWLACNAVSIDFIVADLVNQFKSAVPPVGEMILS
jgi:hypothetical protein